MKKSAATLRAENYKNGGQEWFCGFTYTEIPGLGYEEGVHRRDPSSVIKVDDVYYVWYTKSIGPHFGRKCSNRNPLTKLFPWDNADIWYATSKDGYHWEEQGCAIHRGAKGEYDERTVCTPDVLAHDGKYYLVYQAIPEGDYKGTDENTAMSSAENPNGPWTKTSQNILEPMENGIWFGEDSDNYNSGYYIGLTHDPSLFYYNNKFYLYYKCGSNELGTLKHSGPDTRWGVATADCVTGPYKHSEFNPITNSGHETMLWEYKGGIACLLNRDGPEKDTIQYAKDGINFEVMAHVYDTPQAGGAFRGDNNDSSPIEGMRWGLCHYDERGSQWNYLVRFDIDYRHSYVFPHHYPKNNCIGIDL